MPKVELIGTCRFPGFQVGCQLLSLSSKMEDVGSSSASRLITKTVGSAGREVHKFVGCLSCWRSGTAVLLSEQCGTACEPSAAGLEMVSYDSTQHVAEGAQVSKAKEVRGQQGGEYLRSQT